MIRTFKALSLLLSYPTRELKAGATGLDHAIRAEGLIDPALVAPLIREIAGDDLWDLEERYVLLFDRCRSLSLNLFEHVHGESRDRGGAMVDLLETYRAAGLELETVELPDHLPVLLEFLATRPLAEGRATLADAAHILIALADRLARRGSAYSGALSALAELAAAPADAEAAAALAAVPEDDPADLAALDAAWEEAAVAFGPDPDAGCPAARDLLARMAAPVARIAPQPAPQIAPQIAAE
jgi:nitrate reductase delta subunit